MDFLIQLFTTDSVAHTVIILSLIAALGLALGSMKIFGVHLGIAGVLFAGLIFGHFKMTIDPQVMEFAREFGLILFVYTVGMQVGPGFFDSLKKAGLQLNLMAAAVVLLGVAITILIHRLASVDMAVAVGLFSGATTNTPSLAAAQQALKEMSGVTAETLNLPGIGYAIAYPFGILGIIITMILAKTIFRLNPQKEAENYEHLRAQMASSLKAMNLEVKNSNLNGLTIEKIPGLSASGVVISRMMHDNKVQIAQPDMVLHLNDVLLAVGPAHKLEELRVIIGSESNIDLRKIQSQITSKRVVVTKKAVIGKSIEELDLLTRYGVTITRVHRTEIEFSATQDLRLQFGDILLIVGEEDPIKRVAIELGNSPKQLDHPHVIPIFVGIVLGVILGSCPIYFPGVPLPIKLGLAGGPLIVAVILSRIGRIGPLIWYMPANANFMLREIGIVLFLACVGLRSGDKFVETLTQGQGLYWMAIASLITFVPLAVVALFARLKYKLNFLSLCGLLAGSMTDPPALAFANSLTSSNIPAVSYTTVYPLVMIMRVVSAQVLVSFFWH
ncbi:MAG: putative transporter [Candidatus Omnitrophota bacterium]